MKAKINLTNIGRFIKGMFLYYMGKLGIDFLPKWKREIYEWREIIQNADCKNEGHCVVCGCHSNGKLYINAACDIGCYPAMSTSRKAWEQFKIENTVTFAEDLDGVVRIYFADASHIEIPNSVKDKFYRIYSRTKLLNIKSLWV